MENVCLYCFRKTEMKVLDASWEKGFKSLIAFWWEMDSVHKGLSSYFSLQNQHYKEGKNISVHRVSEEAHVHLKLNATCILFKVSNKK